LNRSASLYRADPGSGTAARRAHNVDQHALLASLSGGRSANQIDAQHLIGRDPRQDIAQSLVFRAWLRAINQNVAGNATEPTPIRTAVNRKARDARHHVKGVLRRIVFKKTLVRNSHCLRALWRPQAA
jgi:hypothetical protein